MRRNSPTRRSSGTSSASSPSTRTTQRTTARSPAYLPRRAATPARYGSSIPRPSSTGYSPAKYSYARRPHRYGQCSFPESARSSPTPEASFSSGNHRPRVPRARRRRNPRRHDSIAGRASGHGRRNNRHSGAPSMSAPPVTEAPLLLNLMDAVSTAHVLSRRHRARPHRPVDLRPEEEHGVRGRLRNRSIDDRAAARCAGGPRCGTPRGTRPVRPSRRPAAPHENAYPQLVPAFRRRTQRQAAGAGGHRRGRI